jgi:hypothetical protein
MIVTGEIKLINEILMTTYNPVIEYKEGQVI